MTSSPTTMTSLSNHRAKQLPRYSEEKPNTSPKQRKLTAISGKPKESQRYKTVDLSQEVAVASEADVRFIPINFDLQDHVERLRFFLRENYQNHLPLAQQMTPTADLDDARVVSTNLIFSGERLLAALSVSKMTETSPPKVELTLAVSQIQNQFEDVLPALKQLLQNLQARQHWGEVLLADKGESDFLSNILTGLR